jgi:hypothetical protein
MRGLYIGYMREKMPRKNTLKSRIRRIRIRRIGWDRNFMIYRHLLKGERTRGLVITNPKKITHRILKKLYPKRE